MTLYIDCDGVLTDGSLTIDRKGEKLFKTFHTRDIRAIREFIARGWEVVLVTADDWEGFQSFADKTGAELVVARDKSQLPAADFAIGDDAWDVRMLAKATTAFCPSDADPIVLGLSGIVVLKSAGGRGVVAEVLSILLGARP